MSHISIYLTNLGKYNEGELVGEWVNLPVSDEELQEVFQRIGIGSTDEFGQPYEEYFITDYETDIPGLSIGEYDNLTDLNEKAEALENLSDWDLKVFKNAAEAGYIDEDDIDNFDSDRFILYDGVDTAQDLGYAMAELLGGIETLSIDTLKDYFDFEAYERDVRLSTDVSDILDIDIDNPDEVARICREYNVDDIDDIDVYRYYGVRNDYGLGKLLAEGDLYEAEHSESLDSRARKYLREFFERYFDFESYGQNVINTGVGNFTEDGFIEDLER